MVETIIIYHHSLHHSHEISNIAAPHEILITLYAKNTDGRARRTLPDINML